MSDEAAEAVKAPEPEDAMLFEISTEAVPAKKFKIDEEVYELFGFEHLSPKSESAVTATFSQFERCYDDLSRAKNDQVAEKVASHLRKHRLRLISLMTSIPSDVADGLDAAKQGKVIRAIQDEIGAEAEDDEGADDGDQY